VIERTTKHIALVLVVWLSAIGALSGCDRSHGESVGSPVVDPTADALPDITLTDAHGRQVSLASLRGGPVLFDFIYTSCPGPCELLTTRMVAVARQLTDTLGQKAHFVSITVDPEHDGAQQLLAFAKVRGADREGWLFLTGTPEQIDQLMARFSRTREHSTDGSILHVLEFFLVGSDGHPLRQYLGERADPAAIAAEVRRVAAGGHAG